MADPHDNSAPAKRSEDTQTTTSPPKDTIIIEEGDILLVCADAEELGKLRVSSIILKHTSPVFKAMLGPHFAEGQAPRSALHPQELHCPEDDWHAMECLMQLLHHCKSWLEGDLLWHSKALDWLVSLGTLADKYQCIEAISLQTNDIFAQFKEFRISAQPDDPRRVSDGNAKALRACYDLAVAAFLFEKDAYFYHFTKRLVMDFTVPCSELTSAIRADHKDELGFRLFMTIEEQRTAVRLKMSEAIPNMAFAVCLGCFRYGNIRNNEKIESPAFVAHFEDAIETCWPPAFSSLSIRHALRTLNFVGDVERGTGTCGHVQSTVTAREFQQFASMVYKEMAGLCVRCLRAGSFTTGSCEVSGHWRPNSHWKDEV
ncbi:hypothetical protein TI39_contig260g00005 [Zymoseptoria brevis]|uniref:BTB domain-containing protein n=1 Tax=Zymoseptoria brevis TaxID=1047168 RepID=A0A0F4H0T2_9PEZI|nr:hypothetical protein TI39_contig260g00005 [Zymoseptoria brevis]